ncbi:hypothetical protein MKW92_004588, partial [Papaver armeniacum]
VAAGSEIHGTPKIFTEDDYVDKVERDSLFILLHFEFRNYCSDVLGFFNFFFFLLIFNGQSFVINRATAINVQTMLFNLTCHLEGLKWESCKLIMDAARTSNTKAIDARFHFEIRTHQRLIDIFYPTEQTLESLMRLEFPPPVDVDVKLRSETAATWVRNIILNIFLLVFGTNLIFLKDPSHFYILLKNARFQGLPSQSMGT